MAPSKISVDVKVFDPVMPFKLIKIKAPGISSNFDYLTITEKIRNKLENVTEKGKKSVRIDYSRGLYVNAPIVE